MPGTKIINVQKNDSFQEVFDLFQKTDAQEVIFIFPRGTVFGKETAYFENIKQEADGKGILVNVMTTDPVIAHVASQYGLGILQNPAPRKRAVVPKQVEQEQVEPEPIQEAPPSASFLQAQEAFAPEQNNIYADLAVARKAILKEEPVAPPMVPPAKRVKDIVPTADDYAVEVQSQPEPEVPLPVSRGSLIPPPAPSTPPQLQTQPQVDIEAMWREEEQRLASDGSQESGKPARKKMGGISKKFIFIPLVGAIIVLGAILYLTIGHAKITVTPKTQDIDLKLKVTASVDVDKIDTEFNKIPGQLFAVEKTASGSYPTTSQKEVAQKASGTIVISNTGPSSQRLVATTRFESKDGLIFRIPETIMVPPGTTAKLGTISTLVYADRAGKEYNIGPTSFTIPGLKDTPNYAYFSATSKEAMSGGAVGTAKVVSEEDYTKAKQELSAAAKEQVTQALKDQTGALKILDEAAIQVQDPKSNAKVGEAADPLKMTVMASTKIIGFQEADVLDLVTRYISKNGDLELVTEGLKVTYTIQSADAQNKTLTFEVQIQGKAAAKLDNEAILKEVQGMNGPALEAYFHGQDNIDTANIVFSPFWVTKVPKDPAQVEFVIDIKP